MARGDTNLAAGVAPEEKDLCYGIRYQGEGVRQAVLYMDIVPPIFQGCGQSGTERLRHVRNNVPT